MPRSCSERTVFPRSSRRAAGSNPVVGSSRKTQLGVADQREREVEPALLAARKRARALLRQRLMEPCSARSFSSTSRGVSGRGRPSGLTCLAHREMAIEAGWDWSTIPIRSRSAHRPADPGPCPSTATRARGSASRKPSRISTVVVLPAPLGPSRPNTSPRRYRERDPRGTASCADRSPCADLSTADGDVRWASPLSIMATFSPSIHALRLHRHRVEHGTRLLVADRGRREAPPRWSQQRFVRAHRARRRRPTV